MMPATAKPFFRHLVTPLVSFPYFYRLPFENPSFCESFVSSHTTQPLEEGGFYALIGCEKK